jgi:hypothetical protein
MAGVRGQHSGGSNRKTVEEHLRNGTFRRDRHGAIGAPSPTPFVARRGARTPRAPDGLSEASAALWRRFHAEYDLRSAPTLELLESALRCRDVAEAARAALEREGLDLQGCRRETPTTSRRGDSPGRAGAIRFDLAHFGFPLGAELIAYPLTPAGARVSCRHGERNRQQGADRCPHGSAGRHACTVAAAVRERRHFLAVRLRYDCRETLAVCRGSGADAYAARLCRLGRLHHARAGIRSGVGALDTPGAEG